MLRCCDVVMLSQDRGGGGQSGAQPRRGEAGRIQVLLRGPPKLRLVSRYLNVVETSQRFASRQYAEPPRPTTYILWSVDNNRVKGKMQAKYGGELV